MTPIEESDLHSLGTILANTDVANNEVKFFKALGSSIVRVVEMMVDENRALHEDRHYYFIVFGLGIWLEKGKTVATVENLVRILDDEEFREAADKIKDVFLLGKTPVQPTVSFDLHKKQIEFVNEKLDELVRFTWDWEMMKIHIVSKGLATPNTVQILNKKSTDAEKFYSMYQEVTCSLDFFEKLKQCLRATSNTDALSILNQFVP